MNSEQIQQLNERFAIAGLARIEAGKGNLPRVAITTPAAEAHVYLHGAHLTHFQPRGQRPVLFLSSTSAFEPGKPIRGGVPICFPWFAERPGDPNAPMHGFARTLPWTLTALQREGDLAGVELQLESNDTTRRHWPHNFEARLRVTLTDDLTIELLVTNTGAERFTFEQALHSYFTVGDVRQIEVTGLAGASFVDKNDGGKRKTIGDEPIRFPGPFDALFEDTQSTCTIIDPLFGRRIVVRKGCSSTTIVWNPGSHGKQFTDLPDNERHNFVCVETANARGNAITLAPGEMHGMAASISLE